MRVITRIGNKFGHCLPYENCVYFYNEFGHCLPYIAIFGDFFPSTFSKISRLWCDVISVCFAHKIGFCVLLQHVWPLPSVHRDFGVPLVYFCNKFGHRLPYIAILGAGESRKIRKILDLTGHSI